MKRGMSDDGRDGLKDSRREGLMERGRDCGKGRWWRIRLSAQRETEKTAYDVRVCVCVYVCVCVCKVEGPFCNRANKHRLLCHFIECEIKFWP